MMAAPHRNRSDPDDPLFQETRRRIQVTQLVERLNNNALGTLKKNSGVPKGDDYVEEYIEMSQGQLTAAKLLLDKSLPSLQAVVLTGPDDGPIQYTNLTEEELDARIEEALKEAEEQGK